MTKEEFEKLTPEEKEADRQKYYGTALELVDILLEKYRERSLSEIKVALNNTLELIGSYERYKKEQVLNNLHLPEFQESLIKNAKPKE
jgi:hypothetical protein